MVEWTRKRAFSSVAPQHCVLHRAEPRPPLLVGQLKWKVFHRGLVRRCHGGNNRRSDHDCGGNGQQVTTGHKGQRNASALMTRARAGTSLATSFVMSGHNREKKDGRRTEK